MYQIGKIINTHGIRGELKVQQITDFTELLHAGQSVYIIVDGEPSKYIIEQHRVHKHHHLIRFKDFQSIEEAEKLKGLQLYVKEDQLPELGENEFHYHEIIGCHMFTIDQDLIGQIVDILSPGANDVWVVQTEQGKEFLIPFIDDVIREIDIIKKKVIIDPMEGLLD